MDEETFSKMQTIRHVIMMKIDSTYQRLFPLTETGLAKMKENHYLDITEEEYKAMAYCVTYTQEQLEMYAILLARFGEDMSQEQTKIEVSLGGTLPVDEDLIKNITFSIGVAKQLRKLGIMPQRLLDSVIDRVNNGIILS